MFLYDIRPMYKRMQRTVVHFLRRFEIVDQIGRIKRIWYLWPMRAAKVQASLRICAVSPEPLLLAHTSSESRGTFRQKARSPAPLNDWACVVKIRHDGMLKDTNSLDAAQITGCKLTLWSVKMHNFYLICQKSELHCGL